MAARLLPLELIDKCIGSRLWIIMKGDKVRLMYIVLPVLAAMGILIVGRSPSLLVLSFVFISAGTFGINVGSTVLLHYCFREYLEKLQFPSNSYYSLSFSLHRPSSLPAVNFGYPLIPY
ncbi:unnamed protein product [Choristocarpus tenellus]